MTEPSAGLNGDHKTSHDHGCVPVGWHKVLDGIPEPGTPLSGWTSGPGVPEVKAVKTKDGAYEIVVVLDGYYTVRSDAEEMAKHWARVLTENGLPTWWHAAETAE